MGMPGGGFERNMTLREAAEYWETGRIPDRITATGEELWPANIPEEDQVKKKVADDPIDRAAEQICDDYCKFSELIKNLDILHNICEGCPLNILMTKIQGGSKDVK